MSPPRKRRQYTNSLSSPVSKRTRSSTSDFSIPGFTLPAGPKKEKQHHVAPTYRRPGQYLGRNVSVDDAMMLTSPTNESAAISSADGQLLKDQGALTLPPEQAQTDLIATFIDFGHVWTPVIDSAWLDTSKPSLLLLQSIFVAASRLTTQPNEYGSTADFYRRAKLLFFFGNERNALISISSAILLSWYSPVGPETVVTDTSAFWLRTAESIAFQIGLHKEPAVTDPQRGLRRRIWGTLVLLDCITSATLGSPQSITPSDSASNMQPPTLDDFTTQDFPARTFPVYVSIAQLLGTIAQRRLRRDLWPEHTRTLETSLFRWVKHDFLTISGPSLSSSLETRQVLVMYFAGLIMLDRARGQSADRPLAARSLLSASFIVGIYRDFLEKDELCRLGPASPFYALVAGLVLIPTYKTEPLWETANEDTVILKACLQILSKQWGAAIGALRTLQKLSDDALSHFPPTGAETELRIPRLSDETLAFFEGFDRRWCRLWGPIVDRTHEGGVSDLNGSLRSILDNYAASRPWGDVPRPAGVPEVEAEALDALRGGGGGTSAWERGLGGEWLLDNGSSL
ncbi:hypothetical protein ASPCAL09686 [Aspergillus calidoustus]|uniref:Xylanolytic transcriptional activator regulatory domain-containing protein n=1 Tax=Aspergillus calidoustus TaxID=454130 RepID=A0A0U5G7G5_ASPCI|nr:hypothetical protein ASPCAL09686 [Aspergillus calidoustus]